MPIYFVKQTENGTLSPIEVKEGEKLIVLEMDDDKDYQEYVEGQPSTFTSEYTGVRTVLSFRVKKAV